MRLLPGARRTAVSAALLSAACGANKDGLSRPPDVSASPAREAPAAQAADAPLPGAELFIEGRVLEVRLTVAPELLRELEERGNQEKYVRASARLELRGQAAQELPEIGVRYKGDYSLHHCWDESGGVRSYADECAKLSLKLKFNASDPELRFAGLKRLNLHAASNDSTKLHELLAYRAFRDAGIRAPRTLPAQVFINDQPRGLYIAVEDVDGRFTRAHFPEAPDGNLYKEIWPNPAFSDAEFREALETNEERGDVSGLRAFAQAVGSASDAQPSGVELGRFLEVDALLRYLAVDRGLRNWDGVTAFYSTRTSHNFFWYHDDGPAPRFHLIPWDLDSTFWAFHPYAQPQESVTAPPVPDLNERPVSCERRVIWEATGGERVMPARCDRLMNWLIESNWSRLVELGREIAAGPLAAERLRERALQLSQQLAPLVEADPTLEVGAWRRALAELDRILPTLAPELEALLAQGLIDERPPEQVELAPPDDIDGVTVDAGLHGGSLTNFEFAAPPASAAPAGVFSYADPLAMVAVSWSTLEPLSGKADLRFDFTFQSGPEPYDEWAGVGIGSAESDLGGFSRIIVWMSADRAREVRVRVSSAAYEQELGGIAQEFGLEHVVGPEPQPFVIELSKLYYPTWAKEGWEEGQGFSADADARARVLQRFTGLMFAPSATVDPAGKLSAETETGHLRIDNIYFR